MTTQETTERRLSNYDFRDTFNKYKKSFVKIVITDEEIREIDSWCEKMARAKMREIQYKLDGDKLAKRLRTGKIGELALGKYLGVRFTDDAIGRSRRFAVADMACIGYNLGCKTVEFGKFPTVMKEPVYPEVIMVWNKFSKELYICGIASVEDMRAYGDMDLILDPNLRAKGTKVGFGRFDLLEPIENIKKYKLEEKEDENDDQNSNAKRASA